MLDRSKWTDSHCPLVSKFSRSTSLSSPLSLSVCLLHIYPVPSPFIHLSTFLFFFFPFSIFIFLNFPFSIILSGCTVSNWTIMFCQSLRITSGPVEVQTDRKKDKQKRKKRHRLCGFTPCVVLRLLLFSFFLFFFSFLFSSQDEQVTER